MSNISLICNSEKFYCSIAERDANGFFKVLLPSSHLLNSRHPVRKSKFGTCAVTGYCSFNYSDKVTLHTYIYQSWIFLCPLFSKCTPSSSCVKPVVPFHCRLCPLGVLFVRRIPGSQALPLLLSFHQHHVVPGSQFSPGYPGLLWLHLDQVPQGLLGHMSCMSTSRFVHHYYKMENIEQAAKKQKI